MKNKISLQVKPRQIALMVGCKRVKTLHIRPSSLDTPMLYMALKWLERNLPKPAPVTFAELIRSYPYPLSMHALMIALRVLVTLGMV